MPTVNSNVKLITSNQAPTTSNLAKGEMAFGQVDGVNSIYGNTGSDIIKIEFTSGGEPIIYFANEGALNSFVEGDDVPASGWYAAIADTVYEQYAYAIYNFSGLMGRSPYDAPITAGEKSSNADDYFVLSPEGHQIVATNSERKTVKFTLTAEAPVNRWTGPAGTPPDIKISFVNYSYNLQRYNLQRRKPSFQPFEWTITSTYDDTGSDYYRWNESINVKLMSIPQIEDSYGYCYITLMTCDTDLNVTGTIKVELVE